MLCASFRSCSYYIKNPIWGDIDPDEEDDDEEDDEITYFLSELLAADGVFAAQVGDAPSLDTAATGNPKMQDRFNFVESLHDNGFVRVVDYEEVCIDLQSSWLYAKNAHHPTHTCHCFIYFRVTWGSRIRGNSSWPSRRQNQTRHGITSIPPGTT